MDLSCFAMAPGGIMGDLAEEYQRAAVHSGIGVLVSWFWAVRKPRKLAAPLPQTAFLGRCLLCFF